MRLRDGRRLDRLDRGGLRPHLDHLLAGGRRRRRLLRLARRPSLRHRPRRRRETLALRPQGRLRARNSRRSAGSSAPPRVLDGLVLVGSSDGKFFNAVRADDGRGGLEVPDAGQRLFVRAPSRAAASSSDATTGTSSPSTRRREASAGALRPAAAVIVSSPSCTSGTVSSAATTASSGRWRPGPAKPGARTRRAVFWTDPGRWKWFQGDVATRDYFSREGYEVLDPAGLCAFSPTRTARPSRRSSWPRIGSRPSAVAGTPEERAATPLSRGGRPDRLAGRSRRRRSSLDPEDRQTHRVRRVAHGEAPRSQPRRRQRRSAGRRGHAGGPALGHAGLVARRADGARGGGLDGSGQWTRPAARAPGSRPTARSADSGFVRLWGRRRPFPTCPGSSASPSTSNSVSSV